MRLALKDLNLNIPLYVNILGGFPGNILIGIVPEHSGDIEVAFKCKDGDRIATILEQSSHASADSRMAQEPLTYRFKNLDGGADALFQVSPAGESVKVTVERSDEGALEFHLSYDHVRKFAEGLKSACSTPSNKTGLLDGDG
jgi:hypothetical protein